MGVFLRILFTVILIFYAFSMIIKLIFRRKLKKLQQAEQFSQTKNEPNSNETTKAHIDPNIGEYTDFEEIE